MGNQSLFVHHTTALPSGTTYTYTRSNRFGAVESRHTTVSKYGVISNINFSDGHGYVDVIKLRGDHANNSNDYENGGPVDGFYEGDYNHLYPTL